MLDRTTKLLLALIAAALWGLLLRPAFTPAPSHAAEAPFVNTTHSARFSRPVVTLNESNGHLYVVDNSGWMYVVDPSGDVKRSVRLDPKP